MCIKDVGDVGDVGVGCMGDVEYGGGSNCPSPKSRY